MLKCIIFDLDGTIGNTLPLCIAAFKKAIEPLAGRVLSDQEIIDTFGPSEEGTVRALIPARYDQGIEDYLKHYRELHGMCAAPFEGMIEVLDYAKNRNVRLAMVTGKGARSAEVTLDIFGIRSYFDLIETGSPDGPSKVQGIQSVLEQLGIKPAESVYVGDAPSDIAASREAGIPIVSAAWAETADSELLRSLHPDELFTSIEEFKQYIGQSVR
ncbi:phosphoglycolate phosphatase [Paenibacillus albidus]|uniref:Phosphoglycolate phosphatase n=1 Tax=Paenibacillus albidus TaxID=2041023 RepID=A0A917CS78_9BACL|nr:HAD family hydrolase [Paenibacillus albidus]GGF95650.1 phosphoglycolate phosphatase [Paenibacillus albidus]